MRIVHFGKYYMPDTGGIEAVTKSLAVGAASRGDEVAVVCFGKRNSVEHIDAVKVVRNRVLLSVASQPLSVSYALSCIRQGWQSDVVHLHLPNLLAAFFSLFMPMRVKLLVHWHSDIVGKGLLGALVKPLEAMVLKRASRIVVTSSAYAKASRLLEKHADKMSVIPIGIPEPIAVESGHLPPNLLQTVKGKKVILAVGRLVPYKGFDVLISAARSIDASVVVVIVGNGPLKNELRERVNLAGLNERVILTGYLADEALHVLFARADIFCLPSVSRAEAFGVVLLEAMAHGLPIVASNIEGSGVPWVNHHDVSGLNVEVGNSEALAIACNSILCDDKKWKAFSDAARQRYEVEFREEVFVSRMSEVYHALLA